MRVCLPRPLTSCWSILLVNAELQDGGGEGEEGKEGLEEREGDEEKVGK